MPPPYSSQVKAAILLTLGLLITKAGAGLKPFVPQLQTTFLKCLNDPSDLVRGGGVGFRVQQAVRGGEGQRG